MNTIKTFLQEGHIPVNPVEIETAPCNPWSNMLPYTIKKEESKIPGLKYRYSVELDKQTAMSYISKVYNSKKYNWTIPHELNYHITNGKLYNDFDFEPPFNIRKWLIHNDIDPPFHKHNYSDGRGKKGLRQCFSIDDQEIIKLYMNNRMNLKNKINIVEIGVDSANYSDSDPNFQTTSTSIFHSLKRPNDIYLGVDIEDKSFLNNKEKNIYTIATPAEKTDVVNSYMDTIGLDKIDILFIDGFHSINQVYKEWEYTERLADKGVVIMHDTNAHPGPYFLLKSIDTDLYDVYKYFSDIVDFGVGVAVKK